MSSMTDRHEKTPAPVDMSFWKENYAPPHGKPHTTFYGGTFAGQRKYPHSKQQKEYVEHLPEGGFLPPIPQSLCPEPVQNTKVQESLKLPTLIEEASKIPQRKRRRQATDPPKELLVIPLLVCFENQKVNQEEKTCMDEKTKSAISNNNEEPADGKSKSEEGFNEEQVDPLPTREAPTAFAEGRIKTLQMDIDWNLDPNTDGDLLGPEAPPLGSLPPINGKKGPVNQSRMANLKAPNASNSASVINAKGLPTGIIRGSLPEELKECCKGSSVGSLIMSPDGEIVCLSLMGATRDADIPIRFDFIPEEEEEDCLPVESAGQEEQWSSNQQDSEKEQDSYYPPSFLNPADSSDRIATPPYRKGKKGKRKKSISETAMQGENVEEFEQHSFAEQIHTGNKEDVRTGPKKDKQNRRTVEKSDQRGEDVEGRNSWTRSQEQEGKHYSAEIVPEDGDEASSTSTDDFREQIIEEDSTSHENMQIQAEASSRNTSDTEQLDSSILQNKNEHKADRETTNVQGTDRQTKNEHETDQQTKNEHKENHQPPPDSTNIRPKLMETKSHHEIASYGQDTISIHESKDNDPSAPSTGQDQHHNKKSAQVIKGSGKQPNLKHKTSDVTKTQNSKSSGKSGNNPEIFKDVEKVSSERKENLPAIPQQTEVTQENSHIEKQQLTEEEELALLQEITDTVTKDTTKGKKKKNAKSQKTQKPESTQALPVKKVNLRAGAEQGKAAFVAGQPKIKKGESKKYILKKPSEQVKMEETIQEIQETPEETQEEDDNDTEKESEDSYVVIEYHERTPTPTESKDIHSKSDRGGTPETSDQILGQTADTLEVTATLEVTSQANEDDYTCSETSEVTSSSVRQRRSSRARELSEKAEKRRLEVERKRREREEQLRLEKEQQERLDKMKEELEQEQLRRAEEMRQRKQQDEEEKKRQEQERARKMQLEQQALERARQQQDEHRRKMQEIQQRKQQEELERIELERQRQKEQEHLDAEERMRLLEMATEEREEYHRKKREREEQARREEEERRLKAEEEVRALMEEAHRQAQLLAKQTAALEQQLQFNRGLLKESVGMDQTQGVSRPWVFSYFEFLELLGMPLPVEGE
ncbi:uncharacterized protein KIAA2012 homolog [Rhinoderma darwinii]|uniref:uncharacterized protein KIAA2012 homolog n=1 Tax=Rhinoderma darwinii TaxID=43563 RepID=UPI003F678CB8